MTLILTPNHKMKQDQYYSTKYTVVFSEYYYYQQTITTKYFLNGLFDCYNTTHFRIISNFTYFIVWLLQQFTRGLYMTVGSSLPNNRGGRREDVYYKQLYI